VETRLLISWKHADAAQKYLPVRVVTDARATLQVQLWDEQAQVSCSCGNNPFSSWLV